MAAANDFLFGDDDEDDNAIAAGEIALAPKPSAHLLHVSGVSADRLEFKESLRREQKRRELAARAPLTRDVLQPFLRELGKGRSADQAARITHHFINAQKLRCSPEAAEYLNGLYAPPDGAALLDDPQVAEADAVLDLPGVKKATKLIFSWVKKTAHANWALDRRKAATKDCTAPRIAPERSGQAGALKSAGSPPLAPTTFALPKADSAAAALVKRERQSIGAESTGTSLKKRKSIGAESSSTSTTTTSSLLKPHGRGAGADRGLDHHGEPKFVDMHPSWQAKRREGRRELKAVTRALRKEPQDIPKDSPLLSLIERH